MSAPASRSASPPRSAPVQKRKRQPRPPPTHPPYVEMIRSAIAALKERGGSSRQKILQYILANFDVGNDPSKVNSRVRIALRSGVEKGVLLRSANAKGANGSFRVGKALEKKKKAPRRKGRAAKKSPRKKARKSAAKKTKRSPKKKSAKKSPKKRSAKKARKPAKARKPKRKSPKKAKPARRPKASKKSGAKKARR